MKIFCTGNPARKTLAYSLPCDHGSLSSGWNFLNSDTLDKFRSVIIDYTVFVNSSYISAGVQMSLLNIAVEEWMRLGIKGHVINVGTTLEHTSDESEYTISKRALRQRSIELSEQTGITGVKTTYLILGGVDNGEEKNNDMVKPYDIASTISWIVNQQSRIPLIQMDGAK